MKDKRVLSPEEIDNVHQVIDEELGSKIAPFGYIEAGAKAQLAKVILELKKDGIRNYNNTGRWLVKLD